MTTRAMSSHDASPITCASAQPVLIANSVKQMYKEGELTDFEIHCKGRVWKVHKMYLAAQSTYFKKVFTGSFSEAESNVIDLSDEDMQVLGSFIEYFYHFEYDNIREAGPVSILFDVRMYAMADKYFVATLKDVAAEKFESHISNWWKTAAFKEVITETYQLTVAAKENPLKKSLLRFVKDHAKELLDPVNGHDEFLEVIGDIPEFGKDVAIAIVNEPIAAKHYRCPNCEATFAVDPNLKRFNCPRQCTQQHDTDWWEAYEISKPKTPYHMAHRSLFE